MLISGTVDGVPCLTAEATAIYLPGPRYARLRDRARGASRDERPPRPVALPPAAVGRHDPRNVVISDPVALDDGTRFEAAIVVDEGHPVYFDHPLDHIPALLILEAFRQTAVVATARTASVAPERLLLTGLQVRFTEFAELHQAATVVATVEAGAISLELRQGDAVRAAARMEVQPCS